MNNLKFICEGFINDLQGKFNQEERDIKSKFFKLDKKSRHFKKRYKNQNIFSDFRVEYINNGFSIEAKTKENTFEFGILYFEALKKFCGFYNITSSLAISSGVYVFKYKI